MIAEMILVGMAVGRVAHQGHSFSRDVFLVSSCRWCHLEDVVIEHGTEVPVSIAQWT